MNKQVLAGLIGGVALATAGGVAGFTYLAGSQEAVPTAELSTTAEPAGSVSAPRNATAVPASAASAPEPAQAAEEPPVAAEVEQRCWDEEVTVQAEPKDDKAIAGTAAGALIGGAIAKNLGDDNDLLTAAGAAAGALAGRKAQRRVQENNTTKRVERRCEPVNGQ